MIDLADGRGTDSRDRRFGEAYTVIPGDAAADRERVLAVWRRCGADYSPAFSDGGLRYDWFYRDNPAGPAMLFFLEHRPTGETVGFAAVGSRDVFLNGQRRLAGLLVDFVVEPRHRVFFPALIVQRAAIAEARRRYDVLIGHPNRHAAAVLRRLARFRDFEHVRYARVLDLSRYTNGRLPRCLSLSINAAVRAVDGRVSRLRSRRLPPVWSRWVEGFDSRYDDLWGRADLSAICTGVRDRRFLKWRFQDRPGSHYQVLEIMRRGSDALEGYFVCEPGPRGIAVRDLWLDGDDSMRQRALLELADAGRSAAVRSVSLGVVPFPALDSSLKSCGFRAREARPVLVAMGHGDGGAIPANWYLTLADSDV